MALTHAASRLSLRINKARKGGRVSQASAPPVLPKSKLSSWKNIRDPDLAQKFGAGSKGVLLL